VLAGAREDLEALAGEAAAAGVPMTLVGAAEGDALRIAAAGGELETALAEAERAWSSLAGRMGTAQP